MKDESDWQHDLACFLHFFIQHLFCGFRSFGWTQVLERQRSDWLIFLSDFNLELKISHLYSPPTITVGTVIKPLSNRAHRLEKHLRVKLTESSPNGLDIFSVDLTARNPLTPLSAVWLHIYCLLNRIKKPCYGWMKTSNTIFSLISCELICGKRSELWKLKHLTSPPCSRCLCCCRGLNCYQGDIRLPRSDKHNIKTRHGKITPHYGTDGPKSAMDAHGFSCCLQDLLGSFAYARKL